MKTVTKPPTTKAKSKEMGRLNLLAGTKARDKAVVRQRTAPSLSSAAGSGVPADQFRGQHADSQEVSMMPEREEPLLGMTIEHCPEAPLPGNHEESSKETANATEVQGKVTGDRYKWADGRWIHVDKQPLNDDRGPGEGPHDPVQEGTTSRQGKHRTKALQAHSEKMNATTSESYITPSSAIAEQATAEASLTPDPNSALGRLRNITQYPDDHHETYFGRQTTNQRCRTPGATARSAPAGPPPPKPIQDPSWVPAAIPPISPFAEVAPLHLSPSASSSGQAATSATSMAQADNDDNPTASASSAVESSSPTETGTTAVCPTSDWRHRSGG